MMKKPVSPPRKKADNVVTLSRDEARHAAVSRKNKKRRQIRIIVSALLLLAFIALAVGASLAFFFSINAVTADGSSVYSPEDIVAASGVTEGDNLFFTNTAEVAAKIEKALPYIETATVKRKLPATLVITASDAVEAAAFDGAEGYVIISSTCKVLSGSAGAVRDGVPYVSGVTVTAAQAGENAVFADAAQSSAMVTLLLALKNAELTGITSIDMTDVNAVMLVYDGRITLKLGGLSNAEKKLLRARETINRENAANPSVRGTLDLTIDPYAYFREERVTQPQ